MITWDLHVLENTKKMMRKSLLCIWEQKRLHCITTHISIYHNLIHKLFPGQHVIFTNHAAFFFFLSLVFHSCLREIHEMTMAFAEIICWNLRNNANGKSASLFVGMDTQILFLSLTSISKQLTNIHMLS